jgi:hypothetical protein
LRPQLLSAESGSHNVTGQFQCGEPHTGQRLQSFVFLLVPQ